MHTINYYIISFDRSQLIQPASIDIVYYIHCLSDNAKRLALHA